MSKFYRTIKNVLSKFDIGISRYSKDKRNQESWITITNFKTIIDAGANVGQFADYIRQLCPDAMIYSFEPLPSCFAQIQQKFKNDKRFKAYNYALGDESGNVEINKNDADASSSILEKNQTLVDNYPHTKNSVKQTIEVKKLDEILKLTEIKAPVLLKIDVQGYEEKLLLGALKTLSKIDYILIELSFIPLYDKQPLFHEVYELLAKYGFQFVGVFDQAHSEINGLALQADLIFKNIN